MEGPYRTYQAAGGDLVGGYRSPDVTEARRTGFVSKERDELERKLEEKTAELGRAKDALREEGVKRESAEQALREAEENYRILMEYAEEGVQIIEKMREQFQEAHVQRTRGKTLITAFLHDLKGPLGLISSCAQFCMGNFPSLPPLEGNLKIIYESSQRANHLARKFLEVFECQMLLVEPVSLNEVVSRTWQMAEHDTQALQVSFEANLEPKLPGVMGNKEGLERVFFNLFLNAIQAVGPKGRVMVQTEVLPGEKMVEVKVMDDGPGIAPEHRHRIFEHFFTTKEEGTGLGLSLCQAIIQQHQGEIHVDCPAGWGTRVCVKLPVAPLESGVPSTL